MTMKIKIPLFVFSCWLISCSAAQALVFTCMAMELKNIDEAIYYLDGEDYLPIKLRSQRRSFSHEVVSPGEIFGFYVKGPMDAKGIQTYRQVGKVPLGSSSAHLLFLLASRGEGALNIGVFTVDESPKTFPAASFKFLNVTAELIAIKFSGDKFKIKPGDSVTVRTGAKEEEIQPVHIVDLEGRTLFKSTWYVNPSSRELVIIHPVRNNRSRSIGLKLLSGRVPKVERTSAEGVEEI
jgi:hypothetical protein